MHFWRCLFTYKSRELLTIMRAYLLSYNNLPESQCNGNLNLTQLFQPITKLLWNFEWPIQCTDRYKMFYITHLIMYGKDLVDKCKNYLKIPMTGLFAGHDSFHDFCRYQFHQWNVLFQKTIWNIYHHWNHAWSELVEYFCCHAFPWLILKKEIFQKAFYFLKVFWTFRGTDKAINFNID